MGLFEKFIKVEEEPIDDNLSSGNDCDFDPDMMVSDVEVNIENLKYDDLISSIYTNNEMSDLSKSIFKVEELINSLPKEMVTKTKKDTVLSILSSFGLSVYDVTNDGVIRMNALNNTLCELTDMNNKDISSCKSEVEKKKEEIAELERRIAALESDNVHCNTIITEEMRRIDNLINFIEVKGE